MTAWWESLTTLERIFAYAAIPSTILLFIQTILLMTGIVGSHDGDVDMSSDTSALGDVGGADADMDLEISDLPTDAGPDGFGDSHGHIGHSGHGGHGGNAGQGMQDPGLRIFSLRGLVAFFSVGGWAGLALLRGQANTILSSVVAVGAGLLAMVILAGLLKLSLKLQSDGSMDLRNAIGVTGTVYLTIPAGERGKVNVMLQGQLRELDAVTNGDMPLKTGSYIQVVDVLNDDTLVVAEAAKVSGGVHTDSAVSGGAAL